MSKYRRIGLDQLMVDEAYQRPLSEKRVEHIRDNFNPALLGALEGSVRNGKVAVFDGQHRLAALRALDAKDAPVLLHEGLSVRDEAVLFVTLQTQRKPLTPIDKFRARLIAGEEQAHLIDELVRNHGYSIVHGGHGCEIGAVASLDRIYDRGGYDLLDRSLELLSTWRDEPRGTDGTVLEGLAIAIDRFGDNPKFAQVGEALEGITAVSLLRKAMASVETSGGMSRPAAVARQVGALVGIRGPYKKRQPKASA